MDSKDFVKKLNRTSTKSFSASTKRTSFLYLITTSFKVTCCSVLTSAMVAGHSHVSKRVQIILLKS
ncbi:hypothetical protein JHK82_051015 [Glycine max]|nr:hypothetical protein JHK85_051716 [Glycine max]KAG5092237.1 hypothetical protein JHK82_051015 [Glycine max]